MNLLVAGYGTGKVVRHDGDSGEKRRQEEKDARAQLELAHLTRVFQNCVIIDDFLLLLMLGEMLGMLRIFRLLVMGRH